MSLSLLILSILILIAKVSFADSLVQYAIIIDAGSTGSRSFIYKLDNINIDQGDEDIRVESFRGLRKEPGLNDFSSFYDISSPAYELHGGYLAGYFLPMLTHAAGIVPDNYHNTTQIYIQGTAGMRLLSDEMQTTLWVNVVDELQNVEEVPFREGIRLENMGTIDGHEEAYYAVLASNFIAKRMGSSLKPKEGEVMVGALDLGGSSTQLVFHTGSVSGNAAVNSNDFWSHSYLGFGVNTLRQKVWDRLYMEQYGNDLSHPSSSSSDADAEINSETTSINKKKGFSRCAMNLIRSLRTTLVGSSKKVAQKVRDWTKIFGVKKITYVSNPCGNPGHEESYDDYNGAVTGVVMRGIGDVEECLRVIRKVMWPNTASTSSSSSSPEEENEKDIEKPSCIPQNWDTEACAIDGMSHPHVTKISDDEPRVREYFAMSVYYYALDCIRSFAPTTIEEWPRPSTNQILTSVRSFCSVEWEHAELSYLGQHRFTSDDQFPYRCLEGLFIVTLLNEAFGFDSNINTITYAVDLDGLEVEWTIGHALAVVVPKLNSEGNRNGNGERETIVEGDGDDFIRGTTSSGTTTAADDDDGRSDLSGAPATASSDISIGIDIGLQGVSEE